MSPSKQQVVYSEGIFQGLPTFPETPETTGLTAIVTGANGISGQHMVKVMLAAPKRWKKIYCLSRRPPPDHFTKDLGEGASRVEHISVDFLNSGEEIGKVLKEKELKADHIFFFSYLQPPQKGAIGTMWSNADELAEVNTNLLVNFLNGLKQANLKPKRFMLQTGAKQYGFHMGPAMIPCFETDPRVTLENNFYYPQEDNLFKYCKEEGVKWNVVRPSYVIGAVRDSALNHMVGFSVYGAVQAYLKRPLAFPGDIRAWEREHCQSTAKLDSYFEEWAVLTPEAENEAFNIIDGNPWTWGRFWIYLSQWYGTTWTPPETDESKYRTAQSRHEIPPRGFGPRGITRSTFSLLEWSHQPEVEKAWAELVKQHGLILDPFKDRGTVFGQSDSAVIGGWPLSMSVRKARKIGWLGSVDSYESAFHTIQELANIGLSVPMKQKEYTP